MYKNYPHLGDILKDPEKGLFDYFDFDPEEPPTPTKDVVFLKGSWYEMGVQYGEQARDSLHRRVCFFAQLDLMKAGSYEKVYEDMQVYVDYYNKYFPDFVELLHGMADGAELGFLDVVATHTIYTPLKEACSHISSWGEATKDGNIYGGMNWDYMGNLRCYEPAVVAFPDGDHAFISASGIATGVMFNDAGLMVLSSGSQQRLPEDHADVGFQYMVGFLYISAKCDSTADALDALENRGIACNIGNNVQLVDKSGDVLIYEHTARKSVVRRPGDFGEKNYMLATNHFLTEEMKPSLFTGKDEWSDCQCRYDTEEQIIKENWGNVDLDTINDALGCTKTYIDGKWNDEVWSLEVTNAVTRGDWSPENVAIDCKCVNRGLVDLMRGHMYIIAGCRNTLASERPYATGNASRLTLKETPSEMVGASLVHAQLQVFLAGRDLAKYEKPDPEKLEYLNQAKVAIYAGQNYMNLADCSLNENEKLEFYGLAVSRYSYAQCVAQLAMDEPKKIMREDFDNAWEELI